MTIGDWLNSLINVVMGLLFGVAAHGLASLIGAGFWVLAILVSAPFVLVLFFDQALDRLTQRLLPSVMRPARTSAPPRGKPLARTLSLPAGFVLGVLAAELDLSQGILAAL